MAARFPLRPGRPLVLRWPGRGWGWACDCLHASPRRCTGARAYLRDTHREALADAIAHIATSHHTPADAELAALEAQYALPAKEPTR